MKDRVAIRRRLHQRGSGEISGSPGTVVHDQGNAQLFLHALGNESYDNVGGTASCKANQPSNRLCGIGFGGFDSAAEHGSA